MVSNRYYLHMWLLITTSLDVYLNLLLDLSTEIVHSIRYKYVVSSIFYFLLQGIVLGTYVSRSK